MFRKLFFIILCGLVFTGSLFGRVKIDKANRVENINPGYCAWCSIEMLGRHLKVKKLYNLTKNRTKESDIWINYDDGKGWIRLRANEGHSNTIRWKMDELGVKYRMCNYGKFDRAMIEDSIKNNLGCAVGFKSGAFKGEGAHAVVLIDYNDDDVEFIDPNDPESTYTAKREWFDYYWDGWVLVVERE